MALVREATIACWNASGREDRLVRARKHAAVVAVALAIPVCVLALWRRRGLGGAQFIVVHVGRTRSSRGGRVVAIVGPIRFLVHGNQDRRGLKKLNLLVFGYKQFRGDLPLRSVLPTVRMSCQPDVRGFSGWLQS